MKRWLAAFMILPMAAYGQTTATATVTVQQSTRVIVQRYSAYGLVPEAAAGAEVAMTARLLGLVGAALILYELFKSDHPVQAPQPRAAAARPPPQPPSDPLLVDFQKKLPPDLYPTDAIYGYGRARAVGFARGFSISKPHR